MSVRAAKPVAMIACVLFSALLAGCNTRGGPVPYDVADFGPPDQPKMSTGADYRLSAGDTLSIIVFRVEELSRDYQVDPVGNIAIPLIGAVPVAGHTTAEIKQTVVAKLNERYLRDPDVTVVVKEAAARVVTIDGSVKLPGAYPATGDLTLLKAVALARGVDKDANPKRVAIFRTVEGKRMAAAFDLTMIRRGEAADPQVFSGDIVVVDGSGSQSVFRDLLATLPVVALFRPF
ncbi:polysaccharide biosynthesis/export family protein [Sphingomonas sp. LM7]|uniref:polysaccharide biosynthesis/export family protein n=1 Tax=Sphingomonas sp. LM7 TaxID=1938607 RepID=UPI000983CF11|nr:polysaccharide biosynthesis/export family protein [Sphingomonas sp. LM7]AQR76045.1 hypothetical protein BXU08_19495 [Sphingomonas sp. LM7]